MMLTDYTDEKRELLIDKDHISVYAFASAVFGGEKMWRKVGTLYIVQDLGEEFIGFMTHDPRIPFHVWKKDLSILSCGAGEEEICLMMKEAERA